MTNRELDIYIDKYINGDNEAFDVIYEEVKTSVYLSIYTIIKDRMLIEDLMQDTFLKAIDSIEFYKLGTNFKAWISRIARNLAINLYNKRKREILIDTQDNDHIFDSPINESTPLLNTAMKILEGFEKEIVVYHVILNFTFKTISKILGIPQGTVFWIYQKALKKIKKEM